MNRHVNAISGRLSLRAPQRESLEILARVADLIPLEKDRDLARALETICSEFPTVSDYSRSRTPTSRPRSWSTSICSKKGGM